MTLVDFCYPVQDRWFTAPTYLINVLYNISRICQNRHLVQVALVAASVSVKVALKPGFDR